MRDSGAACFRCDDAVWEREMGRWVRLVVDKIRPSLASSGGNVLMLQVCCDRSPFRPLTYSSARIEPEHISVATWRIAK